jgi:MFS family permease
VTRTRRTRWLLAGVFAWFGALFGSLAVSVLDVQTALGIGPGALGALLAIGFAIGACAQLGGGVSVERRGPMGALRFAIALMAGALAVVACAAPSALLAVGIVLVLAVAGALNATANACAVGVVTTDVRGFVRFHACYSAGAMCGALTGAAIAAVGGSWRLAWGWWSVVGLVIAVAVGRTSTATPPERSDPPSLRSLARLLESSPVRDLALLLCAAVAAAGAVDTWGVRFLRVERGASIVGGAGAYALAQLVAFVARLRFVPSSDRRSSARRRLVRDRAQDSSSRHCWPWSPLSEHSGDCRTGRSPLTQLASWTTLRASCPGGLTTHECLPSVWPGLSRRRTVLSLLRHADATDVRILRPGEP